MLRTTLMDRELEDGGLRIKEIDRQGIPVVAAYWLYSEEWKRYRLVLVTPLVVDEGRTGAYKKILPVMRSFTKPLSISGNDVTVASPNERIVRNLRGAIGTGGGTTGIRFSRNTIQGDYIEDAFIYRT